jgi:hypothetical protein
LRRRAARGLLQATYANEARELGLYDKPSEANANVAVNASTGSFPGRQLHVPACPTVAEPTGGTLSRGPGRTPAAATGGENVVSLKRKGATQSIASANTATPATGAGTGPTSKNLKKTRISDVKDAFVENQTKHMQRHFRVAVEFLEEGLNDPFVAALTRPAVVEVIELLTQLPKTHGKSGKKRLSLREAVAEANSVEQEAVEATQIRLEERGADRKTIARASLEARIPRLSPQQSLINHRRRINAFLKWCHRNGYLPEALQIELDDIPRQIRDEADNRDSDRGSRLSWGVDRLQKLLTSSVMVSPTKDFGDPLFWATLAGPHLGPRMEEFLQQGPEDVEIQEGVPVMLMGQGLGQRAKTHAARRVVPIHPMLIAAGFMELVEQRRDEGSHWLFPTLDHGHDGRFSSVFTKRFARYREDEGLYDPQRDYHSLRKDFNGSMKRAGVPVAARKALMGHKIVDLTDGVYDPEGDSVAQKLEYIRTIDYGIEIERVEGIPVVKLRGSTG